MVDVRVITYGNTFLGFCAVHQLLEHHYLNVAKTIMLRGAQHASIIRRLGMCKKNSRRVFNLVNKLVLVSVMVWAPSSYADYLGTDNLRIFPAPIADLTDGYDVGDRIEFVIEVTPRDTGSTEGNAAWSTFYIPAGSKVVAAKYVIRDGSGAYVAKSADDVDSTYDGWGARGAKNYGVGLDEGFVNEVQQDTGIFYSTDPRTAQVPAGLAIVSPTGVADNQPFNQWDRDQVLAFGDGSAISGNGGQGNTPMVLGTPNAGTGSPVAGVDTYYTNDYNPANVLAPYGSVGPWLRIETPGDKIGGSGPVTPAVEQGAVINTAVDVVGGFQLDSVLTSGMPATSLPAGTNAVRIVHGARRIGDIERWSVILEVTNVNDFLARMDAGEICADSIPADTTPAKDNNWRYYEVSRSCTELNSEAVLVKEITDPSSASAVSVGQTVTYQFTFTNLSNAALTNVVATDEAIAGLDLVAEGLSGCPANYDGVITPGNTPVAFNNIVGNVASWATIASLPVGASVTYTACGTVTGNFETLVDNQANITYDNCLSNTTPCLTSNAIVPVINSLSGTVYHDLNSDGQFTAGELGIPGVIVELYLDDGDGILNAGDTLISSQLTGSNGSYQFVSMAAGDYIIVETNPANFTSTGDVDNAPPNCAGNGCDTIGGGAPGAAPIPIAVVDATNISGLDFFDSADAPDLAIVKTGSPNPVQRGQQLVYTLAVTNVGAIDAFGVVVTDTLPANLSWLSTTNSTDPDTCIDGTNEICSCSDPDGADTGTVTCEVGDINVGDSETVTITVTVD